jgi:hypothetical protein
VSDPATEAAIEQLDEAVDALFASWDADGDGSIDKEELGAFLNDLFGDGEIDSADLDGFMGQLDGNHDLSLSRKEISVFLRKQYLADSGNKGKPVDMDNLTVEGLTEATTTVSEPEPELEPEPEREPEPEPEP